MAIRQNKEQEPGQEQESPVLIPYKKVIRRTELPHGYVEEVRFSLKEKRRWTFRKILAVLAVLAVLAAAVIFLPGLTASSSKYCIMKDQLYAEAEKGGSWIGISKSGQAVREEIAGRPERSVLSQDGRILAVSTTEHELWLFDGKAFTKAAEGLPDNAQFLLTPDGSVLAYLTAEGALILNRGGKTETAAEAVETLFALSPDGKAAAYSRTVNDSPYAYLLTDREEELGKNLTVHALSERGKLVYLSHTNGIFYVQKGADEDSRARICKNPAAVVWNGRQDEVLAYDGEKTVFSSSGEEAVHVAGGQVTPLRPSGYRTVPTFCGILCLCVTQTETRLIRLDRKVQITTVIKDVDRAVMAENGKTVIYQQEGGLFSMPADAESAAKSVKLASGIRDGWLISRDKTALFYQDREGVSWYLELGGDPVRVTDETVTKAFSAGSEQFVYQTDGRLFYTSGGKGTRVSGFSGEADYLETAYRLLEIDLADSFWCLAGQEGSLYISTDGKDFARISPK